MGVDTEAVLERLSGEILWMALSETSPDLAVTEPGAGYERQVVVSVDWAAGMVTKTFGPAREPWLFGYVALLRSDGVVEYHAPVGPTSIDVGQTYTPAFEVDVFAA